METPSTPKPSNDGSFSKAAVWSGRTISGLCIAFFIFDAIGKIVLESHSVSGTIALAIPESAIQGIGITLLFCTVVYLIPRTAIVGAILLTGYLGGAMAIMMRSGMPVFFALGFGVLTWLGLYLRNHKVRSLFMFKD